MMRLLKWATLTVMVLSMMAKAEAGLTLRVQASSEVDLNNIHVGQVFSLDTVLVGDNPDEYYTGTGGGYYYSNPNINGSSFSRNPNRFTTPLTNNLILSTQTIRAVSAGEAYYYADFSEGLIDTNMDSYGPISNTLRFEVLPAAMATPEPSTLALAAVGLPLLIGMGVRHRRKQASLSTDFRTPSDYQAGA